VFYPPGLPQSRELAYAAERFATIELNGSFYSLQRPEFYAQWYRDVPRGFVFAIKGSRFITHMLKLRSVKTPLANFYASGLFELGEKLGPFLWQLPPQLKYDRDRLAAFFDLLPRTCGAAAALARKHDERVTGRARLSPADPRQKLRHAIEIRHPSFVQDEFVDLLREHEIALVVADTAGKWPLLEDMTSDFVYVRLHGDKKLYASGYSNAALDRWARKIAAWLSGSQAAGARTVASEAKQKRAARRDVYVYFDNDIKVHAPFDAQKLRQKLDRSCAAGTRGRRRPQSARLRSLHRYRQAVD
jgi:uncharacterized protein YecE (DUF72 family)